MNIPHFESIILFLILYFGKGSPLKDDEGREIYGAKLLDRESRVCREVPFKKLDEFSFCSFVKLAKIGAFGIDLWKTRIFTLRDADSTISLDITFYAMELSINGTLTYYQKYLEPELWTKICLFKEANNPNVVLVINYREARKISAQKIEEIKNLQKEFGISIPETKLQLRSKLHSYLRPSFRSKDGNASVCFQNEMYSVHSAYEVSVTAASIIHQFMKDIEDDNCVRTFKNDQIFEFGNKNWVSKNVSQLSLNISEICFDTYIIPFINQSGNYAEYLELCRDLNGRLLHLEEVKYFEEYFQSFQLEMESQSNSTRDNFLDYFWLSGGARKAGELSLCPTYSLGGKEQNKQLCAVDMDFTFCISPNLADFTYYGPLVKYDRKYTLHKDKFSFYLEGVLFSKISKPINTWVISSENHKETVELRSALPMGRQNWTLTNDKTKNLLTLTHCKENEFACSDGHCLPWSVRCNGVVECSDKSDEENCVQLQKDKGYITDLPPPPNKKQLTLKVYYRVTLVNIADITSTGTSIKMEIRIDLTWYDPRIKFWNIAKNEKININNIWSPKLTWVGNVHPGFLIEIDDNKSFTSCRSYPASFETNKTRKFSNRDPYMGTYIRGEDMKILYTFASVMEVPCRFNLEKYPFGKQSCNIAFMNENVEYSSNFKFVYEGNKTDSSDLIYDGYKRLGEYNFVSADHRVDNQSIVVVTIHLKNLYGFHMLNSFVPSVLICIISYSTLYFPIKDFSDRVMLSLTALLVLAALFTQSSNTSVITPYFKLLDIWYVVLIFFCFMTVIYNILLRKLSSVEERKARDTLLIPNVENNDENCDFKSDPYSKGKKKLVFYNFLAIIFFSGFFVIFIFLFCLSASEII